MTLNDISRAALGLTAVREAGADGSLEQMKAIALCIRTRVRQGWHDGQWLTVIENVDEYRANLPGPTVRVDPNRRAVQRLFAEIDDIYYGNRAEGLDDLGPYRHSGSSPKLPVAQSYAPVAADMEEGLARCCYWAFADQPYNAWFRENVLDKPEEHPLRAQMGAMMFFE